MRVPEKFWETHADGFESATGGDDDADGHGGGVVFLRGGLDQGCGLWEARLGRSRELAWRLLASDGW